MSYPSGPNHKRPSAKVTEDQVREIRKKYSDKSCDLIDISVNYGIGVSTVSNIINRKSWKHVQD